LKGVGNSTLFYLTYGGKKLVVELKEYESANAIAKTLDTEIVRTKSMLGEYLRRLDEIRTLAERSKKVRDVVFKLAGKKSRRHTTWRNHSRRLERRSRR